MPRDSSDLEFFYDQQLYHNMSKPSTGFLIYKRTVDVVTSLILLPIMAVICLVVLLLNPFFNRGKLFYSQPRIGKNNKVFQIYKLRTMQSKRDCENPKFATEEDARITPLGRFMRDIHIDELPQVVNVLLGDMSLIGPRPEQPEFFQRYAQSIQGFSMRQSVRPGISGLAQIRWGYTDCHVGARNKLKWDLEYIQRQGFGLEGQIYLKTYGYIFPRIGKQLLALIKPARNG
jgi:lipopolysaccharide/colanic/teichoic acid biosynthesis glycosyltransferase